VNSYLVSYTSGSSAEVEADHYEVDGTDRVFLAWDNEILRVPAEDVVAITKAPN